MNRLRMLAVVMLLPALAAVVAGCGGDTKKTSSAPSSSGGPAEVAKKEAAKPGGALTAIEGSGATVKGKITYDGTPPKAPEIAIPADNKDKDHCLKGDTKDMTWVIGDNKGVGGVVVWLRAGEGKFFKLTPEQMKRTDEVVIDQPFCNFKPHVVALNTYSFDGDSKKLKKTGQVFKVINSAPISHNTAYSATNTLVNAGKNEILTSKKEMPIDVKPGSETKAGGEELLSINCDIHKWMTARALVFDHPYAVTKEDGTYEIKNAPADAEVTLCYWHETFGNRPNTAKTKTVKLKAGDNAEDFMVK